MISQGSVYLMVGGAMIAASGDLAFNWFGYIFLTINNLCTAAQSVVIKQKLINKVRECLQRMIARDDIDCFLLGFQSEWTPVLQFTGCVATSGDPMCPNRRLEYGEPLFFDGSTGNVFLFSRL